MKVKSPHPIYLEGSRKEAILLLHSFTGTIRDVKPLAKTLNEENFTCFAPNYQGHGLPLDQFTQFTIQDWWNDVLEGYQFLKNKGFDTIFVTGISLGGLFTLKLAELFEVSKIAVMSAPSDKEEKSIAWRMERYGQRMNQLLKFDEATSKQQLATIQDYQPHITEFKAFITIISNELERIHVPARILYGGSDDDFYQNSAHYIFNHISSDDKDLTCHPSSRHLMTYGEGHEDVITQVETFFKSE